MTRPKEAWSDYWRREGRAGEVFVDAEHRKHPALGEFWRAQFAHARAGERVVDLACGAGSIFASLPDGAALALHAVDVSAAGLALLRERFPAARPVVASADALPFPDGVFDRVVSQFGVEYAGRNAFAEAGRLVAPGGCLTMLCHYRDGAIDRRTRTELEGARLAVTCAFVDRALELTAAAFGRDAQAAEQAARAFLPAERRLAQLAARDGRGVHVHLYTGFRQLYGRRQHYARTDIEQWLEGMRGELDKVISRLGAMHDASMDRADMEAISAALTARGLVDVDCAPFHAVAADPPVAWHLAARRP